MRKQSDLSKMVEDILEQLEPWSADIIDRVFRFIEQERAPVYSQLYRARRETMEQEKINSTIGRLVRQHIQKRYQAEVQASHHCLNGCVLIKTRYTVLYGHDLQPCSKFQLGSPCPFARLSQ